MKNILVIRLSAIGDVLLTTPVLARLRKLYPAARIHFLVKERYTDFIAASPDVDELITWKPGEGIFEVKKKFRGSASTSICCSICKVISRRVSCLS